MKRNYHSGIALMLICCMLIIAACRKREEETPEPKVQITINTPQEGAMFQVGDTIHISAEISSPIDLHGYAWTLTSQADGTVLHTEDAHAHNKTFTVTGSWVNNVAAVTEATLEITAEIDHEGKTEKQAVHIMLHP